MTPRRLIYLLIVLITAVFLVPAFAYELPKWFPFNQSRGLDEWQEKVFKGKVLYEIKAAPGQGFLLAQSQAASSGLFYRIRFDVYHFPMISWEWKVDVFPSKGGSSGANGGWIERDDYAARVYVIFLSWNFNQIKTLEYIWDEKNPAGTVLTSPYSHNIKLFVIESGRANLGRWVAEERNIFEDYKKVFGARPPRYAGAVALMTDADNSVSTAEAAYKNLRIGYKDD